MELQPARLLAPALAAALALALAFASPAAAQGLRFPPSQFQPPPSHRLSATQAIAIARRQPKVRQSEGKYHTLRPMAYLKGLTQWQVSFFKGKVERAQVLIDDSTGVVLEDWNGPQVAWRMARGYPGAFAGKVSAPYVWLPLCALFVVPFVSFRRLRRLIHLDLAVLLAFGVSHIFFNKGNVSASVPLVYPVLAYLLARMLWEGFRPRVGRGRLIPHVPLTALAVALVFLVGFRVALNVADSSVIDVGYAGVIGADRIAHGQGLYRTSFPSDNEHGDTYGPADYLVYVPFEQAFPWSGHWDDLPAAHAAAIAFDLLTIGGLFVLGRRLRSRELGLALAFAWAAYPYTLYALDSNSNDTLVAALLVWALVLLRSPPARGALVGIGAAAKFAPLALAPLFAGASGEHRRRDALATLGAIAAVVVFTFVPFVPHAGLRHVWDRTLGYQIGRDSPFSIWGEHHGLAPLWTAVKVAVGGLAVAVAFVPRRKSVVQVAALGAAVLLALQIAAAHWFYLYIVWFAPFALVALLAPYSDRGERHGSEREAGARDDVEGGVALVP